MFLSIKSRTLKTRPKGRVFLLAVAANLQARSSESKAITFDSLECGQGSKFGCVGSQAVRGLMIRITDLPLSEVFEFSNLQR
jgi:hypothetical protein